MNGWHFRWKQPHAFMIHAEAGSGFCSGLFLVILPHWRNWHIFWAKHTRKGRCDQVALCVYNGCKGVQKCFFSGGFMECGVPCPPLMGAGSPEIKTSSEYEIDFKVPHEFKVWDGFGCLDLKIVPDVDQANLEMSSSLNSLCASAGHAVLIARVYKWCKNIFPFSYLQTQKRSMPLFTHLCLLSKKQIVTYTNSTVFLFLGLKWVNNPVCYWLIALVSVQ